MNATTILTRMRPGELTVPAPIALPQGPSFPRLRKLLASLGPGLITGASDDDPSGIGTYSMAGAAYGYATLWTAVFAFPLMAGVQYTCAKIGLVSGSGLTTVLRKHYPKAIVYPAVLSLLVANTINAGADISAISSTINQVLPVSTSALVVLITLSILGLQLFGSYRLIASTFKWLTLALFAYIAVALFVHMDVKQVAVYSIKPEIRWNNGYLSMLLAILGTTLSPYLFFWQTDQEVEEKVSAGKIRLWQRRGADRSEIKDRAFDVSCGMLLCSVVMYFIILSTGATLFPAGQHNIGSANEAAMALQPLAGRGAMLLFTLGIVGSGLLAVPILTTSAAYALCQGLGWKHGLHYRPAEAPQFYAAITMFTITGAALNMLGINPIQSLLWAAIINGLAAPPLLILITMIANNKKIMGSYTNGHFCNALCCLAILAFLGAATGVFVTLAMHQ